LKKWEASGSRRDANHAKKRAKGTRKRKSPQVCGKEERKERKKKERERKETEPRKQ
jgi:hypothetical protein